MKGDFGLGDWQVQPQIGIVTKEDDTIHLEPKVMEVLVYLAQHAEEVLPKERIITAVWGDAFVTDEVLTNAISELRKAFRDDARDPHMIQTLPRRGYRLIAGVTPPARDETDANATVSGRLWQQSLLVILPAVLLFTVTLVMWWNPFAEPGGSIDTIAVLPFINASDDKDSEYLSDGIPETISAGLSQLPQLKVKPTSVLERYRGQQVAPEAVSRELGVRAVLTGRVERRGDKLIVRADLVDGQTGLLIWGRRYSRDLRDIFAIETDIARQATEGLRLELTEEESEKLVDKGTQNSDAHQAHLRAYHHHVRDELEEAAAWNERAVSLDPEYQEAYYGLGWNYFLIALWSEGSEEHYSKSRAAWSRVVEIDDSSDLAYWCRAWILFSFEKDWREAERAFRRAKEVDPNLVSTAQLWFYEAFLDWMGLREERFALIETAQQRADPLSAEQQIMPGYAFLFHREYDRAIRQAEKVLDLDKHFGASFAVLADSYDRKGMEAEAFAALLQGQRLSNRSEEELVELEKAFEEAGMHGVRRWLLDNRLRSGHFRCTDLARLYASLGEKEQAFEWLEKAWDQPLWGYENAPSSCTWDNLRDDPRFEQLLRKLNLPEDAIQRHLIVVQKGL